MEILYLLCNFLQPVCIPIPEIATVLWASTMFGAEKALILGVTGSLLGILFMYYFVKHWIIYFEQKEKISEKIKKFQFYIKDYCFIIIGILFVMPVLPDEIICIGAVLSGLNVGKFMGTAFFAKIVSIGMVVYSKQMAEIFSISRMDIMLIEITVLMISALLFKLLNRNGGSSIE